MNHNSPPGFGQLARQGREDSVMGLCERSLSRLRPLDLLPWEALCPDAGPVDASPR